MIIYPESVSESEDKRSITAVKIDKNLSSKSSGQMKRSLTSHRSSRGKSMNFLLKNTTYVLTKYDMLNNRRGSTLRSILLDGVATNTETLSRRPSGRAMSDVGDFETLSRQP